MNMTNEVRTAAYTLMQRHLTEPFANDEERRLVLRQADDACEILAAWLDAQPAAPTERWEPVADMSAEEFRNPDAWLAGNICICHRVEVKP